VAKLAGAGRIYAADRLPARLDLATYYGADIPINVDQQDVVPFIQSDTAGRGVDVAIEAAWVDGTLEQCSDAARNGGRVIVVGIPVESSIKLPASSTRRKGLTIKFSRRMNHTYAPSINLVMNHKINLRPLASHVFPLDQASQAFEIAADYRDNVIRAVIQPNL
jgi:L-iditol 2-dehydrogenase